METVVINWHRTKLSQIAGIDDSNFYLFVIGFNIYYIGMTKKTSSRSIIEEILKTLHRLKISSFGLQIWIGYVDRDTKHQGSLAEKDDSLIKDSGCLIIFAEQPLRNDKCKKSYTGRSELRVINNNLPYIHSKIWCDEKGKIHPAV